MNENSGTIEAIKKTGFAEIKASARRIGEDWIVLLCGGREHIGCAVLAVPRPSLADPHKQSVTSSVLNVSGHKDEWICRKFAEDFCRKTGHTVVCTGGFHADGLNETQIREVLEKTDELLEDMLKHFAASELS